MNALAQTLGVTSRWQAIKGVATLLILALTGIGVWLMWEPRLPTALLKCVSAGLPDLSVVCRNDSAELGTAAYIDFGDGSGWRKFPTGDGGDNEADASKEGGQGFFFRYDAPGTYEIKLRVCWEYDDRTTLCPSPPRSDQDDTKLKVAHSKNLPKPLKPETLEITSYSGEPRLVPMRKSFFRRLSEHRIIGDSSRKYSIPISSEEGWHFSGNCKFTNVDSQFARYGRAVFGPETPTQATFRFRLESSSFFRGFEDGWLSGYIECEQLPNTSVERHISKDLNEMTIERYGVFEIDLSEEENPIYTNKDIRWNIKFVDSESNRNRQNPGAIESSSAVELSELKLSLTNIEYIPLEIRKNKAYIMVEEK